MDFVKKMKAENELRQMGYNENKIARILFGSADSEVKEIVSEMRFRNEQSAIAHFIQDVFDAQEHFENNLNLEIVVEVFCDEDLVELEELEELE